MKVPPLGLDREYKTVAADILPRVEKVFLSGHFILGPEVKAFEESFAKWVGTGYSVGVASGTDALYLALRALRIGEGDEVITTPFTYFATVEGIVRAGATPVLADIDPVTYTLDPLKVEAKITSKTKAILPVHLYGQCADMKALLALCQKHKLHLVEDCAQAHGATFEGKKAGSFGEIGCFSFYPTKNLGAYGDGGAVTMDREDLSLRLKELRTHGTPPTDKYFHQEYAANSRLDEVQAAILNVKLTRLNAWLEARQKIAAQYNEAFRGESAWLRTPEVMPGRNHVYHQYTLRTAHRDRLLAHLASSGVSAAVYYPHPMHLLPPLKAYGYKAGDLPVTEAAAREVLSLPCFPQLTSEEQSAVIRAVLEFGKGLK